MAEKHTIQPSFIRPSDEVKDLNLVLHWNSADDPMFMWSKIYKKLSPCFLPRVNECQARAGMDLAPSMASLWGGYITRDGKYWGVAETCMRLKNGSDKFIGAESIVFRQVLYHPADEENLRLDIELGAVSYYLPPTREEDPADWHCEEPGTILGSEPQVYLLAWPESAEPWRLVESAFKKQNVVSVSSILMPCDDRWSII